MINKIDVIVGAIVLVILIGAMVFSMVSYFNRPTDNICALQNTPTPFCAAYIKQLKLKRND